jgi:2-dehydro-3-deoxygalactonokinase
LNIPDVMRGEEVQIFGALRLSQRDSATLVLPGTHSKWADVQNGRVTGFNTYMTGEVYALLSQHSILSKTLDVTAAFDTNAFLQGVDQSQQTGSVLHHLFGARTLGLFNRMPATAMTSYLSGLLIGEELRTQAGSAKNGPLILIGNATLTMRYTLAMQHLNIDSQCHGSQATWAGLFALAATLI